MGAWREKVDFTVKEGRFQGCEGRQAKRISLNEVEERLAKPKMGKEVKRQEKLAHEITGRNE